MKKRDPVKQPPRSIEEGLALVRTAMKNAGLIGGKVTLPQMKVAFLESTLASDLEKLNLTAGLPGKMAIPKEWGWPESWVDSLFHLDTEAVGLQLYSEKTRTWHIVAVKAGALLIDSRTNQPVCFDNPKDAKVNIDSYNSMILNKRSK